MPDLDPSSLPAQNLRFGPGGRFELQPARYRLLVDGQPAPLGGRALDLLFVLASRPSQLLDKDELFRRVWPGLVVEENNLRVQVTALRKVVGDDVVATVPGRGYRFVAPLLTEASSAPRPPDVAPAAPMLYGRDGDLQALKAAVAANRLVTVLGGAGMGKTTLARAVFDAVAPRWAHGGCWVDLVPLQDAALVPQTVAAAAGLSLGGKGPRPAALGRALAPLQMLLVLDNAEHLQAGLDELLQAVLDDAPGVHLLVTSQQPLRHAAEQRFQLEPLAVPPPQADAAEAVRHAAVQLFVARASALQRSFALDDHNVQAVSRLCRLLDGSPLALELAAGRLPLLGLQALLQGLDQRLALLSAGPRRPAGRQHSLREAMDWSCSLLDADERRTLARLSVFAAPVDLPLLQAVLADDAADAFALVDRLQALVEASLVTVSAGEPPRYGLLETPRAWAADELHRSGEEAALRDRHARALGARAEAWLVALDVPGREHRARRRAAIDALRADIDAAFAWALEHRVPDALRLLVLLAQREKGHAEKQALLQVGERLLSLPDAQADDARALAAQAGLRLAKSLVDSHPTAAAALARTALAAWQALGHVAGQVETWGELSAALAIEDPAEALRCAQAAAALMPTDASPRLRAELASAQAKAAYFAGDTEASRVAMHAELRWRSEAGDALDTPLINLAMVERKAGQPALAVQLGQRAIQMMVGTREERSLSYARLNLVRAALDVDDRALARATLADGWPGARRFGLYLDWLERLLALAWHEGRVRAAFRIAHAIGARLAADGVPRLPDDDELRQAVLADGRANWPAATCAALAAEAQGLTDEQLHALAMAGEDA